MRETRVLIDDVQQSFDAALLQAGGRALDRPFTDALIGGCERFRSWLPRRWNMSVTICRAACDSSARCAAAASQRRKRRCGRRTIVGRW